MSYEQQFKSWITLRRKKQSDELQYLLPFVKQINEESKFSIYTTKGRDMAWRLIDSNFIDYNGDTRALIYRIYLNICANYHINGVPTTFLVNAYTLANKSNPSRKKQKMESIETTKTRLKVLEKDGVIGRIVKGGKEGGSFIYMKVDISKDFIREEKASYKNKEQTTSPNNIVYMPKEIVKKREEEIEQYDKYLPLPPNVIPMGESKENRWFKTIELEEHPLTSFEKEILEKRQQEEQPIKVDEKKMKASLDELAQEINDIQEIDPKTGKGIKSLASFFYVKDNQNELQEIAEKQEEKDTAQEELRQALAELEAIDTGDKSKDEVKQMFIDFCKERQNNKGQKITNKNKQGIILAKNALLELAKKQVNPYDALQIALGRQWQGIRVDWVMNELKPQLPAMHYNNSSNYVAPVSNVAYTDLQNTIEKIQNNDITTSDEAVKSTIQYQAVRLQQQATLQAKKDATEAFKAHNRKEVETKLSVGQRIIQSCKGFNKKIPINQNLFLNILDKGVGEKTYKALIDYYAGLLPCQYPQEIENKNTFLALANSMLDICRAQGITYIPLFYIYFVMQNLPENWKTHITYDLLNDFYNQKKLDCFLIDNVFNTETQEVYDGEGRWKKIFTSIKFSGFIMEEGKQKHFNEFVNEQLMKFAINNKIELSVNDLLLIIPQCYYDVVEEENGKMCVIITSAHIDMKMLNFKQALKSVLSTVWKKDIQVDFKCIKDNK